MSVHWIVTWAAPEDRITRVTQPFASESVARRWAADNDDGRVPVVHRVERPDPPHEWKVGDWYVWKYGKGPRRIVDIHQGMVAIHTRSESGDPACYVIEASRLHAEAVPCDPPEWWTGDR
jgi:hypothetical protein